MAINSNNKLLRKKPNRLLTARRNYYVVGGSMPRQYIQSPIVPIDSGMGGSQNPNQQYNTASTSTNTDNTGSGVNMEAIAGIGTAAAQGIAGMIGNIQSQDIKDDANNRVASANNAQVSAVTGNDSYDQALADYAALNPLEHVTAKQMGASNIGQMLGSALGSGASGFAGGMSGGMMAAGISAGINTATSLIGSIARNRAARKAARKVNAAIDNTSAYNERAFDNRIDNIADTQMTDLLANYAAYGGPIHIKPENKGKFTETKKRTGKTTEELTHSSNPLTRKRAIFAQNAKKWHHAFGGELNTQGGDFTNGLLYIDNGGSHESNPYEGVQLGIDQEGTPNLVEEGETVFNDYVFSRRIKVPKAIRNKYKMRGKKSMSFADMSKQLAKESEERPNDPISANGLEAMMYDLASAQESIRASQQERQYKNGGKLFWNGGYKWFGQDEGDAMQFMQNGVYTDDYRNYVTNISEPEMAANYAAIQKFYNNATAEQKKTSRWKNIDAYFNANPVLKSHDFSTGVLPEGLYDFTKAGGLDGRIGGRHYGIMSAEQRKAIFGDDPSKKTAAVKRYFEYGTTNPIDYFDDRNDKGQTWFDLNPGYSFVDSKGTVRDPVDVDGVSTTYTDYYLKKNNSTKNRYYIMGDDGQYSEVTGDNPYLDIMNRGNYSQSKSVANDLNGNDYYYDPDEPDPGHEPLPTGLRYAPVVGLGLASISDAAGLTNRPDYSSADAVLEASRGAGIYQPVRFNPIGNYLTYKPFDRDYYINKMNAEAGASRRALLNTARGNRATAMAGILAADNNYLNQIGGLARQAEEYNLAQRQQVEDFNRSTNITNSQGMLQADMANQKALMDARQSSLKGTMAAAEMREKARLMSEQTKSANLSGLFTALGDIGRENMAWNWRNFGLDTGTFGPIGDTQQRLLTHTNRKSKNKKGLTV